MSIFLVQKCLRELAHHCDVARPFGCLRARHLVLLGLTKEDVKIDFRNQAINYCSRIPRSLLHFNNTHRKARPNFTAYILHYITACVEDDVMSARRRPRNPSSSTVSTLAEGGIVWIRTSGQDEHVHHHKQLQRCLRGPSGRWCATAHLVLSCPSHLVTMRNYAGARIAKVCAIRPER